MNRRLPLRILGSIRGWQGYDLENTLVVARRLSDFFLDQEFRAVREMRRYGATWADVGDVLGVSRQAVQQRYGPHVKS